MDIKGLGPHTAYEQFRIKQEQDSQRPDKSVKDSSAEGRGDEVAVSGEARLRGAVFAEAAKASDIREDKVAQLKALVDSGQYEPDAKSIASGIIRDEMQEWEL